MDGLPDEAGQQLERNFVRNTYDHIATDFSSTRYKKWPKVEKFIGELPKHSLLLDVGCGNGKYLDCPAGFSIGCDISQNLLSICKNKGFEVVLCDMTRLPFREETYDAVICVAALHHVVGSYRRQKCLEAIVRTLSKESARLLVQVWSFEQDLERNNPYLKRTSTEVALFSREQVTIDGHLTMPIHINRTPFPEQDLLVPFNTRSSDSKSNDEFKERHLRYYHVFRERELDELFDKIDGIQIIDSYYDRGNWCITARRPKESADQT